MKYFTLIVMISVLLLPHCSGNNDSAESSPPWGGQPELKTQAQKYSYAMGYNVGNNLRQYYDGMDDKSLIQGVFDAVRQNQPAMSDEDIKKNLEELQREIAQQKSAQQAEIGKTNEEQGKKYLEENAKREGVKQTPSGLQYEILKEGTGPSPQSTDTVVVHYRGTLIDGREFDSSFKRGEPATFALNRVIPGWTEALQLMKKGAKYKVVVPHHLAYGNRQASPLIGPNSTLIFEIELLNIISNETKTNN